MSHNPARKWSYYAVKYLFKTMITIFYSEVETVGSSKFPKEGPVIVAINHVNSLTDAAITLSSCPRDVRLTCKDTLLTQGGVMSLIIRNTESIPFQRRSDHVDANASVDNTQSVNALLKELSNGCCVGLFPEGLCRYKPQLSRFRTGVARSAIDYVLNVLSGAIQSKYDYIHIVPVGITYLHREMFRSDVSVRVNAPIRIDKAFLDGYDTQNMDRDAKYAIAQDITASLKQAIAESTISSSDWHTICLSHLSRQIAFPESSSPRLGTFCAQYVDLTRKFNKIFIENAGHNTHVDATRLALNKYWRLLYAHGLKDNRILEMQRNVSQLSIVLRLLYRGCIAAILNIVAAPGFLLALPLVAAFRFIRYHKVKLGFARNYDEIAHEKMAAIVIIVPILAVLYGLICGNLKLFCLCFPFVLWFTMRISQDAAASTRSFWSLLKMLSLSRANRAKLLKNRKMCEAMVGDMVNKFNVYCDNSMIDTIDMKSSKSISDKHTWFAHVMRRLYYGRIKNDWNETIRLYDVPVDEFHLDDKHQEQLQMSYKM